MKVTTILATFAMAASLNAAVIEQVIVRQQWPWSTDVKVEYKLSGVTSPVDISVKAFNGNVELDSSRLAASMTGDRYGITEDGVGTIIIDPVKAFGTSKVALANFKVKLSVSDSVENINEVLYKIVDLVPDSNGKYNITDVTRRDFYNGKYGSFVTSYSDIDPEYSTSLQNVLIWTGVTNPVYKTSKLVLRKISVLKDKSFSMGSDSTTDPGRNDNEVKHDVTLTKDYWISVFEVTQAQVCRIYGVDRLSDRMGAEKPHFTNGVHRAMCPFIGHYNGIRGNQNMSSSYVYWPRDDHEVGVKYSAWGSAYPTVLYKMRQMIPLALDLPTEAQWEFACRGGTVNGLYSNEILPGSVTSGKKSAIIDVLGRYKFNGGFGYDETCTTEPDENTETLGPAVVGSYRPNAYGLYDMYGNVQEWVLDAWGSSTGASETDPKGPENATHTSQRVCRGRSWSCAAKECRSAYRNAQSVGSDLKDTGFRVCVIED